jgi:hypothetical protein
MKKLLAFCLGVMISAVSSQAANIVFVSFHPGDNMPNANAAGQGFTQAPDVGYTQLLAANGHSVTRVPTTGNPLTNATILGADLIIISRSVPSADYQADDETAKWNGIPVPTIILGGYIIRGGASGNVRLGYLAGDVLPDTDGPIRLRVNAPGHPIFAGVALDSSDVMVNTYATSGTNGTIQAPSGVLQRGISANTLPVAAGGTVLATVAADRNAAGRLVIAEWKPGAIMNTTANGGTNDILGGRRLVLLTGTREVAPIPADGAGIYDLTPDGAQLLLNAVNYMTSGRSSIISVNTIDNESPGPNDTSLLEALSDLQDGDYVRFDIPGAGPHTIVTPFGGYPLITKHSVIIDGFSQSNSVPNSNSITNSNNAQQRIVLDSTSTDTLPDPNTGRPFRRSTRLDFPLEIGNTGYGDTENGMLAVYEADNVRIRGLSFLARHTEGSTNDPAIYAVALVRQATNAHVSGCLFGMAPGGTTMANLRPPAAAVAGFRWRIGGDVYSDNLVFGTDGDGFDDRAEFNVVVGTRIGLALELPGARVSGNYINVFPNGNTFVDIDAIYAQQVAIAGEGTVEFMENGRFAHNTIIGTDGNGVSDADERNIVTHTVYDVNVEFYSAATNVVIAGNYFGVGANGTTPGPVSTNINNNFLALPGTASARIGSNGDGVSDTVEGNLIVNGPGSEFVPSNAGTPVVSRGNKMRNCKYLSLVNDPTLVAPELNAIANNIVSGSITPPPIPYTTAFIDLYTVDPVTLANTSLAAGPVTHPSVWLGGIRDNGPGDLDPADNQFAINISSFGVSDATYLIATATYSTDTAASNAGQAVTGPPTPPLAKRPSLTIELRPSETGSVIVVSWLGPEGAFELERSPVLDSSSWLNGFPHTHTAGRNVYEEVFEGFDRDTYFFRLISQ